MERLYQDNRGLIGMWVYRYAPICRNNPTCSTDDLYQAGFIGLTEAARTWDADKGAWSTWASYHIRMMMRDALGLRKKRIHAVSLDAPIPEGEDSFEETIADESMPPVGEALEQLETARAVREAAAAIPDAQVREAIERVYLRNTGHKAAADAMGIPINRVGALLRKGRMMLMNDARLREAVIDEETKFHAHKSVTAFMRDHTSVVEAAVIFREEYR